MVEDSTVYVGFDVSKAEHAVAIAESGRTGSSSMGQASVPRRGRAPLRNI